MAGGKTKNKRRERKKQIEYYSYDDSDDNGGDDDAWALVGDQRARALTIRETSCSTQL